MAAALAAAALFGASTPLAKQLTADLPALWLAGLAYLGSGLGLAIVRLVRDGGWKPPLLSRSDWGWLSGTIAFGGILGPVLLMIGLQTTDGAPASLLLNLEGVFTAVLAWLVFRESTAPRIVLGMLMIIAGSVTLSWSGAGSHETGVTGPLAIAGACLCWGVDNNLTRRLSNFDALFIAGVKGLAAGVCNTVLAFSVQPLQPAWPAVLKATAIGFAGYGVSLVLFVIALRGLGTARTGAYFSTAPFIGAVIAIVVFGEASSVQFWIAAAFMTGGVWLHVTERHDHEHRHSPMDHTHSHRHDAHHRHEHDFAWDGTEPHAHWHRHGTLVHRHAHFPDAHHRHSHSGHP